MSTDDIASTPTTSRTPAADLAARAHLTVSATVRADVHAMHAYPVPDAHGFIKLDAMENPYQLDDRLRDELAGVLADVALNRYPVPRHEGLIAALRVAQQIPDACAVSLGNGSDELIHLLLQICAKPGAVALAPLPGFVMYGISTQLNQMRFVGVPLGEGFSLDRQAMLDAIAEHQPAVVFLAYPNNPTGNLWDVEDIEAIAQAAPGLVVIDEAYQPFAGATLAELPLRMPQVVVLRTLSKLGLAGIRLGYVFGHPAWIDQLEKVRPPYNINVLTQATALFALQRIEHFNAQAACLRRDRQALMIAVAALPGCTPYPSAANFVLLRVPGGAEGAAAVFQGVKARGVLIKNVSGMHPSLAGCVRLTVGTPEQNDIMVAALAATLQELKS